jgi:hypothetical protein
MFFLLPFVGLYISVALLASLHPVPWRNEIQAVPSVRQLHGTIRALTWSVKTLVSDLSEIVTYVVPGHKVSVYVPPSIAPEVAFGHLWELTGPTNDSSAFCEAPVMVETSRVTDFILIPSVDSLSVVEKVEMSLSVVNPLWEETGLVPVSNSPMTSAVDSSTFYEALAMVETSRVTDFILIPSVDSLSLVEEVEMSLSVVNPLWEETGFVPVSNSPTTSAVVVLVVSVLVLAFLWLLWGKRLVFSFDAPALGAVLQKLRSILFGMDAPTSSVVSNPPLEGEVLDVWIHPWVESAIMRLERQRAVEVVPELEFCITKGWTAISSGADGAFTDRVLPAVASEDASEDYPVDHLPHRVRWALVPRRLETLAHDVVLRLLWALLMSWEEHIAAQAAVPVPVEQQAAAPETTSDAEEAPRHRRRNRPSQAQRRRRAKRMLAEQQVTLE